jgi:hypothetical protein
MSIDVDRIEAVRTIGGGSAANRIVKLRELQTVAGQYDQTGQRNLTRDITASLVGYRQADRYAPVVDAPRETYDTKVAMLENGQLDNGTQVEVLSNEAHSIHIPIHAEKAQGMLEAVDSGQADPKEHLDAFMAYHSHLAQTLEFASQNMNLEGMVAETKQLLQYLEEVINNTQKSLEADQRKAMAEQEAGQEAMMAEQGQPAEDPQLATHRVKMQIMEEQAALEMRIRKAKADQELAIKDAEMALKLGGGTTPVEDAGVELMADSEVNIAEPMTELPDAGELPPYEGADTIKTRNYLNSQG